MDKRRFLDSLAFIESSSGKNTKHRPVHSTVHKGESAYGKYAMMPNTIRELTNRDKIKGLEVDPVLLNGTEQQIKQKFIENPELEEQFADKMYNLLAEKFNNDPEKMMYAYQYGHNLDPKKLDPKVISNSDRVIKMRKYNQDLDNQMAKKEKDNYFKKLTGILNVEPMSDDDFLTEA